MNGLNRGDVVIAALQGEHGKPRPCLVIQSVLIPITSTLTKADLIRVDIEANERTGLRAPSQAMINLVITGDTKRIDRRIGELDRDTMLEISRKLAVFLGIAA